MTDEEIKALKPIIPIDDMHIDFSMIDGYNADDNFIMSPRHDGKTTMFMLKKAFPAWQKDFTVTFVQFRNTADISESALQSYIAPINKFYGTKFTVKVSGEDMKKGLGPVYVDGRLFLFFISMIIPVRRMKGLVVPNARLWLDDEYIIDPTAGEKYLQGEYTKYKTAIDTIRKEGRVRAYHLGNPYSIYNVYTQGFGVDMKKYRIDTIQRAGGAVFWYKSLDPRLKAWLKEHDPTYKNEEDEYTKMALEGIAVNDEGANIKPRRGLYSLDFLIRYDGITYAVYRNQDLLDEDNETFYVEKATQISKKRLIYAFEFSDLVCNAKIASREDKERFWKFRAAYRVNDVAYDGIEAVYAFKEIYNYL